MTKPPEPVPNLLLIGDGRLARHLAHYFQQAGVRYVLWSRRQQAEGRCPELRSLVHRGTRALLAISDRAIDTFVATHDELREVTRIHFSGRLVTPVAIGAHPLCSFAATLYPRELYERIPFVLDRGAPPLSNLIPGLSNPAFYIDPASRARYHALCVLAGNFTTLLWRKFFFEMETAFGIDRQHALPYLESIAGTLAGGGAPLSGPLSRGDAETIRSNLESLQGDPFEEVYRAFLNAYHGQQTLSADTATNWLSSE